MNARTSLLWTTVLVLAVFARAQVADLTLAANPIWSDDPQGAGYYAVRVYLGNDGKATQGELVVSSQGYEMRYPVDLPTGSEKSFEVYVPPSQGIQTSLRLQTGVGSLGLGLDSPIGYESSIVDFGLISQTAGLQYLVQSPSSNAALPGVQVARALPEDAPERTPGYSMFEVILLGEGAERLSDKAVAALQRFVLAGGRLIIFGGASTPILEDPRWAEMMPLTNPRRVTLDDSDYFRGSEPTFTATTGDPRPGAMAYGRPPMHFTRGYGLGEVIYLAFNPLEGRLSRWDGMGDVMGAFAVGVNSGRSELWVDSVARIHSGGVQEPWLQPTPVRGEPGDPFMVTLPPTSLILGILVAYAFLVVPVNFLVLRLVNRSSWAWATCLLISLGAAFVIFSLASNLYSARESRAAYAVVIADAAVDTAYVRASQELFFPVAGTRELGMEGVEAVGADEASFDMFFGGSESSSFQGDLYDVGEVVAPNASVRNLDFRRLVLVQALSAAPQIEFEGEVTLLSEEGLFRLKGEVRNLWPYTIESATLGTGESGIKIGRLDPGQTVSVDGVSSPLTPADPVLAGVDAFLNGRLALIGEIVGLPVGAQVGEVVETRNEVYLVYTFPGAIK